MEQQENNKQGISDDEKDSYDDMVEMSVLNQTEILNNIYNRYNKDMIFTLIGPTLIVINPYKQINGMFDEKVMQMIADTKKEKQLNLSNQKEYPHIYSISASSYENLFKNNINQSIVISGESGAGKTENAKYAMRYLTQISTLKHNGDIIQQSLDINVRKLSGNRSREGSVTSKSIEQQILFCNPIMEAFGNAKTVRNNNSSRFGKYVSILVEYHSQIILGAQIQKYLLEKSRVTHIANNERNYHIFYQLLSNKQLTEQIGISSNPQDYYYLNQSGVYSVDSMDDSELFQEVQKSFSSMGFYSDKIFTIWQILGSILLIGNIQFESIEEQKTIIKNKHVLSQISKLLQCDEDIIEQALTFKILETGKQQILCPLKGSECIAVKNSLSKVLYDRLFTWLVQQLNSAINPPALKSMKSLSIGLLDIFGFENFQINSFEQMCINYTNERLQKLYISYVFINEEKILKEDGLADYLNNLVYSDNQTVVDLIDSNQGILQLLNDQCKNKGGNDKKFLESLKSLSNKFVDKIQFPKIQKDTFIIKHTASDVEYTSEDFCEKNKDEVSKQIENCMSMSKNQVVVSIFSIEGGSSSETNQMVQKDKYLGEKFRNQMNDLMKVLNSCQVHFVRCIKPNETKQKDFFVKEYVSQQIQYLGVLESIEVRKQMYPFRKTYQQFYDLYYLIDEQFKKSEQLCKSQQNINYRQNVETLIKRNFPSFNQSVCLFGNTKIYLKQESERDMNIKKHQILKQLKEESEKKLQNMSSNVYDHKKLNFLGILNRASKDFKLHYQLRNIIILSNLKSQRVLMKILETWKLNAQEKKREQEQNKMRQQEQEKMRQIELKKKMIEEQLQKQKEEEEHQGERNQIQDGDQYDYEDEQKMGNLLVSDSKSNMHLINQAYNDDDNTTSNTQQFSDTKRNLLSQLNESLIAANNQQNSLNYQSVINNDMSYQSVALDQSYASMTGIRQYEQEDQRKIDEIINRETNPHKEQDQLISQYTSIGKYYANKMELSVEPPNQYEVETPPLILTILENSQSFEEGDGKYLFDLLNIEFKEQEYSKSVLNDFRSYDLDNYFKQILKKRTKNLFQTKTIKEIMTVQRKELSSSLTKLTKEEDKKSVEIFKDILQLMDKKDEAGNYQADVIITSIIKKCKKSTLLLKDEVFLQMLKQINNNQNKIEITRILQLMVAFSYTFRPSLEIILSALQFLDTIYKEFKRKKIDEFQAKLFQYLLNKLIKDRTRKQTEKEYPLAMFQVRLIINLKQVIFPLILPNGSQYSLSVDPLQTVNDIKLKALQLMDVPSRIPSEMFAIFEIKNIVDEYEEKLLQETEMSWDLISEQEFKNNQSYEEGKKPNTFFLLKIKYCYKFCPYDAVSIQYFHSQTALDIVARKILLNKEDNIKIACLNIYLQRQTSESYQIDEICQIDSEMTESQKIEISEQIKQTYTKISPLFKNKLLAKLEYISIISNYNQYMSWLIRNVTIKIDNNTSKVSLNINPNQLIFIYSERKLQSDDLIIPVDCIATQIIEDEMHLVIQLKKHSNYKDDKLPNMIIIQSSHAKKISQYFSQYIDLLKQINNYRSQSRSVSND